MGVVEVFISGGMFLTNLIYFSSYDVWLELWSRLLIVAVLVVELYGNWNGY